MEDDLPQAPFLWRHIKDTIDLLELTGGKERPYPTASSNEERDPGLIELT
jgi:hypothetical protein